MQNVGFIGWRGMVGSVLMDRMQEENDFANINPVFLPHHKRVKTPPYLVASKRVS